jgi:hypothetical protein
MKENKTLTIMLFIFGILFSIIGFLGVDKLTAINNEMAEMRKDVKVLFQKVIRLETMHSLPPVEQNQN